MKPEPQFLPRRHPRGWLVAVLLGLGACAPAAHHAQITSAQIEGGAAPLLDLGLQLEPSSAMLAALDHGIALNLRIEIEALATPAAPALRRERHLQLRYLPLADQYQLADRESGALRLWPRRALLLAALDRVRLPLDSAFANATARDYRVRIELDHDSLPGPLRLPALIDPEWQLMALRQWHARD